MSVKTYPEYLTVKYHIADINARISPSEIPVFADELLQAGLIGDAGHGNAIAVTGISPQNKISNLTSEAVMKISTVPDLFYKFVEIVKTRDENLATTLTSEHASQLERRGTSVAAGGLSTTHGYHLAMYDRLKKVYRAPPPAWDPLPYCEHIKLAVIKEKGKRRGGADETLVKQRMRGEVEALMSGKVVIEVEKIFDSGVFDEDCQVILVEGAPGMGKTRLAYYFCQKWAGGTLGIFDLVALVRLRDLAVSSASSLADLLLLACASQDEVVTTEMVQQYVLNEHKLLLVLDGWDEAPDEYRKVTFVTELLCSVSSQSVILITSRPDSSVQLHGIANRAEILGFTKANISEYFKRALSTELPSEKVEDGCKKLKDHFRNYPVIQSSCYIPLNAAILAYIFLSGNQTLPSTQRELLCELVLCCIVRELETRQEKNDVGDSIFSLDDLPCDLRTEVHNICVLAYQGIMQNKVVFLQKDLQSFHLPEKLLSLGLLQISNSFGRIGRKTTSYHFIHLSVQELLAAYHISKMEEEQEVQVFQELLGEPRFSAVLQFYAGFTKLTNRGVQSIISKRDFRDDNVSKRTLLSYIRCIFEAQISDQSFYQQIIPRLNGILVLSGINLSPHDCISVGYFLAFVLRFNTAYISVDISSCSIDDHSLSLLLAELSKHYAAAYPGDGVSELQISRNSISEDGIDKIAGALRKNRTMKKLGMEHLTKSLARALGINNTLKSVSIEGASNVSDKDVLVLAKAIARNATMEFLWLAWSSTQPSNILPKLGRSLRKSALREIVLHVHIPPLSEVTQAVTDEWALQFKVGGKKLLQSLEDSRLMELRFAYAFPVNISLFPLSFADMFEQATKALTETAETVNVSRQRKGLYRIAFHIY